ncbi:MAG: hypothetical protein ACRDRI_03370, partial [Pseudonocardiaceae bacterium]
MITVCVRRTTRRVVLRTQTVIMESEVRPAVPGDVTQRATGHTTTSDNTSKSQDAAVVLARFYLDDLYIS